MDIIQTVDELVAALRETPYREQAHSHNRSFIEGTVARRGRLSLVYIETVLRLILENMRTMRTLVY